MFLGEIQVILTPPLKFFLQLLLVEITPEESFILLNLGPMLSINNPWIDT